MEIKHTAPSFGGAEILTSDLASKARASPSPKWRAEQGINSGLRRISVDIEVQPVRR